MKQQTNLELKTIETVPNYGLYDSPIYRDKHRKEIKENQLYLCSHLNFAHGYSSFKPINVEIFI
jgi:hypothetical protein